MKIAAITDVHLGNHQRFARGTTKAGVNLRARLILKAIREAYEVACEQECDAFVIPGDFFDVVRPEPQLIAEAQAIFQHDGPAVHMLVGNHEQASDDEGDHALGPMRPVAHVHEKPIAMIQPGEDLDVAVYLLPYSPKVPGCDYVEQAIADIDLRFDLPSVSDTILFAHLGVEDSGTPVWIRGAHDSIKATDLAETMRKGGISCAIVGNWHDHRVWRFDDGIEIVQCGALVPTGFDNPSAEANLAPDADPYGSLVIWDSTRPRGHRCERIVINGPRFVKGRSVLEVRDAVEVGVTDHGHTMFARLIASADAVPTLAAQLPSEIVAARHGTEYHCEVVADHDDVKKRIQTAAIAARDAQTTELALAEYVAAMPLDEDLDRQQVLDEARKCIAGA